MFYRNIPLGAPGYSVRNDKYAKRVLQISVYSEFMFTHVIHGKVVVCNLSQLALIEKNVDFFYILLS